MSDYEARWHDTLLRWRVTSGSRPDVEHVVDLGAHGGNGECSCEHFQFRLLPKIQEGHRCETATRCSHIMVARKSLTDHVVQKLMTSPV